MRWIRKTNGVSQVWGIEIRNFTYTFVLKACNLIDIQTAGWVFVLLHWFTALCLFLSTRLGEVLILVFRSSCLSPTSYEWSEMGCFRQAELIASNVQTKLPRYNWGYNVGVIPSFALGRQPHLKFRRFAHKYITETVTWWGNCIHLLINLY